MAALIQGLSKDRHHSIFTKIVGTVIMLPSESAGVIVNHEEKSGLRVSCIFRKTVRKAIAQWWGENKNGTRYTPPSKEFELETPTLMLSAVYGIQHKNDPPLALTTIVRRGVSGGEVALVALNETSEDRIMVKPYRIGNVYDGGNICWGKNAIPKNLREAHNLFWSSGINIDFGGPKHNTRGCVKTVHNFRSHNTIPMLHRHEHSYNCANTEDFQDYNELTSNLHGPWQNRRPLRCQNPNCRGIIKSLLTNEEKVKLDKFQTICLCCIDACSKESGCICCCPCCQKTCGCACQCDCTDQWIEQMQKYQESLDQLVWEDWTRPICGKQWNKDNPQFFSYNGHCDAIFISYDEDLIKKVGPKHVRKHYTWDAVIGLATMTKKGWEIDIGNKKFTFSRRKIVPLSDMVETPLEFEARQDRIYAESQERARREREAARIVTQRNERRQCEREEIRMRVLEEKIELGQVSERASAVELWRRFYTNESNSSWWQSPESLRSPRPTIEVGHTWTN